MQSGSSHFQNDHVKSTLNEEFAGREVRTDVAVTQETQLGEFHDTTEVMLNKMLYQGQPPPISNLEGFDLSKTLERAVTFQTITWNPASSPGAILSQFDTPADLLNNALMADRLKGYKYFRADTRITVRVVAPKNTYGALMVEYTPLPYLDPYATGNNLYRSSGSPHVIVSASASEASVMDVPYILPFRFLDMLSAPNVPGIWGMFQVKVLAPLTSITTEVASARIIVSMQFRNAQVFMPDGATSLSATSATTRVEEDGFTLTSGFSKFHNQSVAKSTKDVKQLTYPDMNASEGKTVAPSMNRNPNRMLPYYRGLGGSECDEMDFDYIMGTPMLTNIVTVQASSTPQRVCTLGPSQSYEKPTFVDTVISWHSHWSGSFKFKGYIIASIYHKVSLVFWLSSSSLASVPANEWTNTYHHVVDISGDTQVDFELPYLEYTNMSSSTAVPTYYLTMGLLSWTLIDPAVAAPITVLCYKAGASDMKVVGLLDNFFTPTSNPRSDFQRPFERFHDAMGPYLEDNIVRYDDVRSLRDHLHAFQAYAQIAGGATIWNPGSSGVPVYGIERFGLFFRFRRGSIRFRILQKMSTTDNMSVYIVNGSKAQSAFMVNSRNNEALEFVMHPPVPVPFQNADVLPNDQIAFSSSTATKYLTKAAGDDFYLMFLRAYPDGVMSNNGSTGVRGLVNWGP